MIKQRFSLFLLKRLARKISRLLPCGKIDSLGRLHVFVRCKDIFCHITLVDYKNIFALGEDGLFIHLYEKVGNIGVRLLKPWQMPSRVSMVTWKNLILLRGRLTNGMMRKALRVLRWGKVISQKEFQQLPI